MHWKREEREYRHKLWEGGEREWEKVNSLRKRMGTERETWRERKGNRDKGRVGETEWEGKKQKENTI